MTLFTRRARRADEFIDVLPAPASDFDRLALFARRARGADCFLAFASVSSRVFSGWRYSHGGLAEPMNFVCDAYVVDRVLGRRILLY